MVLIKLLLRQMVQSIKIRLINGTKPKKKLIMFLINELIISAENNTNQKKFYTPLVINKTIVIDAGHGGDDVGASWTK